MAERIDIKDLRADVTVNARHTDARCLERRSHSLQRFARLQRKAEFGVDLAGADEIMRMRVDTRLDAEQHAGRFARCLCQRAQQLQLSDVIHHDTPHTALQRHGQLISRLIVSVEINSLSREPRLQRRVQLAAGHHIRTKAFFVQDTVHPLAAERFAGIQYQTLFMIMRVHGIFQRAAVGPDGILVHHIQRRTVFRGQRYGIQPADRQMSMPVDSRHFCFHTSLPLR